MTSSVPSLHDMSPGKVVADRYRVVQPHRQGGLSVAYEVVDEDTGDTRELQLFGSSLFEREDQLDEVRGMLAPWSEVVADTVARVVDITTVGSATLVVVTDFPQGPALRQRLEKAGRFSAEETVALGERILEGLREVHARGLVHGDLKPATIHVEGDLSDPTVTLVDGGVTRALWTAKHLGDQTALIGTPFYAPIEQFGGDAPSVQSDLYNTAAVLFECVTGKLPWAGKSFVEVFQAKLDRTPPSMQRRAPEVEVDPELERVIVRGCLADRKERYATADEFLRELSAL